MAENRETAADRSAAMNEFRKGKVTGKTIINMPVVALDNGDEVGRVHDVIYSPREGKLIGLTIPHNAGVFSHGDTLWLDAESIHAVGEDAIVVQNATVFRKYDESAAKVAAAAGESIVGKRLMTEDGSFLGAVDDILVEQDSLRVVAYEVSGGLWADMMKGQTDVPVDKIVTIGEDVAVVPSSVKPHIEQASGGLAAVAAAAGEKISEFKDATAQKIDQVRSETAAAIESKEADYALGKVAGRPVYQDDANTILLIGENEIITQEHIARAITAGKMHALALAAGMQQTEDAVNSARENISAAAENVKQKTGDVIDQARDKYGDSLVGKTTGRTVLTDTGVVLIPAGHIVNAADVEAAKATGKLGDLSLAVGAGMVDDAKENVASAYDATREKAGEAYDSAKDRLAAEQASFEARKEAARARESVSTTGTVAPVSGTEPARTVVIESPETVVVQPPMTSGPLSR